METMKNIRNGIICLSLVLFAGTAVQAQQEEKDRDKDKYKTGTEKDRDDKDGRNESSSDREMNERLTQDVYSRKPATKDAVIVWDNTDEGYEGNYAIGDVKYMAVYDKQGNYVETLTERKWDDNVPANVRNSYNSSTYRSNKVDRFWEVDEPNKKGYYLELKDNDGKSRRIWSDKDGKFLERDRKTGDN
jgi:hypothetical protein